MAEIITSEDQEQYEEPYYESMETEAEQERAGGAVSRLMEFMGMNNIAEEVDDGELRRIGAMVIEDMEEDEASRDEWLDEYEDSLKLARQVADSKTWPWEGAANIKYPLIGQAAMNFNARAYPEIVQGDKVAKARVIGDDPNEAKQERADRIAEHMSYQLLEEIPNWEGDTDKLTMILPIVGTMFRKVTWNEVDLRPEISLMMPDELIVNYHAKSLELSKCRRISEKITLFKNDIKERERAGLWEEIDYTKESEDGERIEKDEQEFVQQIRYLDLDNDGYEEPYIVTVHIASERVVRIVANYDERTIKFDPDSGEITKIDPYPIYTDYHFVPNFDGSFYSLGFGSYLYPISKAINTLLNQLTDAGTLNNLQSGFIAKGARIRGGSKPLQPGEWRPAESKGMELKNSIIPLPTKEPSPTLYNLCLFLIETGKQMSSVTDVLSGVPMGQNTPVGTTLALIEQGMKEIDAVYKRIYRALKRELKMLYRINAIYLDEQKYAMILDNPKGIAEGDYAMGDMDIVPVGDPRVSTQMVKVMRAQAARDVVASTPGGNLPAATRRLLEAMDVNNVDELVPEGPDANSLMQQVEFLQGMVQQFQGYIQSGQMQMAMDENARKNQETQAKVQKDMASAVKTIADAESVEAGQQLSIYQAQLSQMSEIFKQQVEIQKLEQEQRDRAAAQRVSGMGQPPGNA